jgi:hypothetical protein
MLTAGVSYNIHCNFTDYGSALESWALYKTIEWLTSDAGQIIGY